MNIPLNSCTLGSEERQALIDVFDSTFVTMGKKCIEFENAFAEKMGCQHAIFVNSGSSANLLAFFALQSPLEEQQLRLKPLGPDCEVIVPSLTWSTTIWPIVQIGATPVLVDVNPHTLQIDVDQLEKAISPKTAAICPVHILGNAVDMHAVLNFAEKYNLWVIEDTCEALGTKVYKKNVGTFGDFGTYSFFFSHHMTTIEGGMIVTNDDHLAETCRSLRAHGWTRHLQNPNYYNQKNPEIDPRFLFINTGFNLRPTDLNGAIGLCQLKKLDSFNQGRNDVAQFWKEALGELIQSEKLSVPTPAANSEPQWFGFPVLCENREIRNKFQNHLEASGIETRPIICGNLARQPVFKKINYRQIGDLTGADQVMDRGLYWGLHPDMNADQRNYVVKVVKEFFTS